MCIYQKFIMVTWLVPSLSTSSSVCRVNKNTEFLTQSGLCLKNMFHIQEFVMPGKSSCDNSPYIIILNSWKTYEIDLYFSLIWRGMFAW